MVVESEDDISRAPEGDPTAILIYVVIGSLIAFKMAVVGRTGHETEAKIIGNVDDNETLTWRFGTVRIVHVASRTNAHCPRGYERMPTANLAMTNGGLPNIDSPKIFQG